MKLKMNFKQTRATSAGDINSPNLLVYTKIKHGKLLEHKISWKVLKIFTQKWSKYDNGLTLTFLCQDQICFLGFRMGIVY